MSLLVFIAGSNYINATFTDSFLAPNSHLLTQAPMKETVDAFWSLVWNEHVCVIVNLLTDKETDDDDDGNNNNNDDNNNNNHNDIVSYIPETMGTSVTFGCYDVKYQQDENVQKFYHCKHLVVSETSDNMTSSEKNMTSSERRHVYYYHFTKWPTDIYPLGSNLMDFVSDIQTCYRRFPPLPGDCDVTVRPVLIHDRDGSSRAALLSLVLHLTE